MRRRSKEEIKKRVFGLRFTDGEWAQIERAARLADREVFDWSRRVLLRVAKRQIALRRRRT